LDIGRREGGRTRPRRAGSQGFPARSVGLATRTATGGTMLDVRMARSQMSPSLGTRYQRRDAGHVVWEVSAQYAGSDGLQYVILRNLADPTWQKTLSLGELDRGTDFTRLAVR